MMNFGFFYRFFVNYVRLDKTSNLLVFTNWTETVSFLDNRPDVYHGLCKKTLKNDPETVFDCF